VHGEMLEFAARHRIRRIVEEFPMTEEGIMECMERLEEGKMRYRGVLVAQQISCSSHFTRRCIKSLAAYLNSHICVASTLYICVTALRS
jgi:hypothetical protein